MTTTAPTRKKVLAVKKIQVESWGEIEDLMNPATRGRKSIIEKYPGRVVEFWLDDPGESELKLMCRVTDTSD